MNGGRRVNEVDDNAEVEHTVEGMVVNDELCEPIMQLLPRRPEKVTGLATGS